MAEKKKTSMAILLGLKPKPSNGDESVEDHAAPDADEGPGGVETAMSELLSAIESKDPKAMAEAFQSAAEICGSDEE